MHRRQLLAGAALAVGLAGCSGTGDEDPAEEDEPDPTESPTRTPTPSPDEGSQPTDSPTEVDSPTETEDGAEAGTGERVTDVAPGGPHSSFAGGAVYVAGDPVRALDPADGRVRWRAPVGSRESLTLAGGTLYLVDRAGALTALDAETGDSAWSLERPNRYSEFRAPPAVGGGTVVVPLELRTDGPPARVIAVDAATGERQWTRDLGGFPEHPAVVRDGAVYVAAGSTVRRRSLADGSETWRYEAGASVTAPPAVGSFCYVGTESGELYGLDPDSGEELSVLERGQLPIVGVTASNGVYMGTDAGAGDARRIESWAFQIDGQITTPPALATGHYVVGSSVGGEGQVTAIVDDG